MKTQNINSQNYLVDQQLTDFTIFQKVSSNVDFFGTDHLNKKLFVQFKGGTGAHIYSEVPVKILTWAENAESIGKFISSEVVGIFPSAKTEVRLVKPVTIGQTINTEESTF